MAPRKTSAKQRHKKHEPVLSMGEIAAKEDITADLMRMRERRELNRQALEAEAKRGRGAPSTFNKKAAAEIIRLVGEGWSLREIEQLSGMPNKSTVLRWLQAGNGGDEKYKEFLDQYARARVI